MAEDAVTRKLAAILYADVAEYSRLTEADEMGTHRQLSISLDLMGERIGNSGGQVVHYAGDALLARFESVVAATNCAIGIQSAIDVQCSELDEDKRLLYRIGINLGEVIIDRDDIYGDDVNLAARLESLADPGGICISESVYEQVNDKVDAHFEDMGEQKLKNIGRVIQAYRVKSTPEASDESDSARASMARLSAYSQVVAPASEKGDLANLFAENLPSIMILPFKNLSGDDSREALVDGFRLTIQSVLVKLSGLFLINAPAASTFRDRNISAIKAGNEAGIRYVLDGAVQMAGERMRVTVQLTDAPAATIIWAESYDRIIDDIFEIQDEITTEVAVALDIKFGHERGLVWWDSLSSRTGREYVLRGLSHMYKGTQQDNLLAQRAFEDFVRILPEEPQGLALLAFTLWVETLRGWSTDADRSLERATELALKAIGLGDPDGFGHLVLASIRVYQRQYDEALSLSDEACIRRLSCPLAMGVRSDVLHYCGNPGEAIETVKQAIRHTRLYPPWMVNVLAASYRDSDQITPSISVAKESLRLDPENLDGHVLLCTDYSLSGSSEEAGRVGEEILRIFPSFSIAGYLEGQPYRDSATLGAISTALREARLPD